MKNVFRWLGTALLILTCLMLPVQPCAAQCTETLPQGVLAVDLDSTAQNPDGRSWECAFPTIQEAIDEAEIGDEIWVKAGVYTLSTAGSTFMLKNRVNVHGGFAGIETLRTQADPYANPTILSGDVNGDDDPEDPDTWDDNAYHVVTATNIGTQLTRLDGFIIEGGDANNDTNDDRGGGLLVTATEEATYTLAVTRCVFNDNHASRGGAASVRRTGWHR